jgi:mono/diheme cytochrome c family protein
VIVAVSSAMKSFLFVFFLVLVPTVPVTIALTRAMRRSRRPPTERDVVSGRAASTPFRLISVVGIGATVAVMLGVGIAVGAQALAGDEPGESVAPVENGGAGASPPDTIDSPVPEQGNATAGRDVFLSSGCGDCHSLLAARATGTRGPNLDESEPDFTRVVECVTTGPGDMPSFAGRLSNAEIRDVAKFVAVVSRG